MKAAPSNPIGRAGALRFALRLAGLAVWLLVCLFLYFARSVLPGKNSVARLFLSGVLRIVGGRLNVVGPPAEHPSILLSNHISWLDIPAISAATGSAFVAHDGLAGHPFMRFLCRLNHTVFIARSNRADVSGQVKQVKAGLSDCGVLTLFPEGTTGDGITMLPFKSSLLSAVEGSDHNVAIRPVLVDYHALDSQIAWTDQESGICNFKRVLARAGRFSITVHLLAPLNDAERGNRKIIAAAASQAISQTSRA